MNVTTLPHKVQPSRYALHLLRLWIRRNAWWAFGIPVTVSLVMAMLIDLKFIYIAVILVCLILPHVFVSVYWHHLLSDNTCRWLLPHTMTLTDDTIVTTYVPEKNDDSEEKSVSIRPPFTIDIKSVNNCRITDDAVIIYLGDNPYDIVIIPLTAFPDTTATKEWYRTLSSPDKKYKPQK